MRIAPIVLLILGLLFIAGVVINVRKNKELERKFLIQFVLSILITLTESAAVIIGICSNESVWAPCLVALIYFFLSIDSLIQWSNQKRRRKRIEFLNSLDYSKAVEVNFEETEKKEP